MLINFLYFVTYINQFILDFVTKIMLINFIIFNAINVFLHDKISLNNHLNKREILLDENICITLILSNQLKIIPIKLSKNIFNKHFVLLLLSLKISFHTFRPILSSYLYEFSLHYI